MLVKGAKVLSKLTLSLNVEVLLVAEENDATSGDQAGKVILLRFGELGKVYSGDFSPDLGIVVLNPGGYAEKVAEVLIAVQATVMIWHLGEGGPFDVREGWEQVLVLIVLVCFDLRTARLVLQGLRLSGRNGSCIILTTQHCRLLQIWSHIVGL